MQSNYHPEPYWTKVAERIKGRSKGNVIAGDDEPYYRYKRSRFIEMLEGINFENKKVLEVGCGPGGNLEIILKHNPRELHGVDISQNMIDIASEILKNTVILKKINGTELPYEDQYFDIVFTATVLQHNTDDKMMRQILSEICRVSKNQVFLFERIDKKIKGDELCLGRPVNYYADICKRFGFSHIGTDFINIHTSYLVSGVIRKVFNPASRQEGESPTHLANTLQAITLPLTKKLDKVIKAERDIAKMEFTRNSSL